MGTVFRAEHTLIGRVAAIKVLHPEMTTNKEIVNRFFNEAKTTSTIKHPGIVEVFDFGYMPSGHAYLVMEYLEGESLAQRMRARGIMPDGEAAMLVRGVCTALAAAHAKGVVHRDLKPDNIFIVPEPESPIGERTKILDFGIAKLTEVGAGNQQTKAGAVMGTPTYMSPEQCRGTGEVDHRADLYSIGCILYELVVGRPPFDQTGAGELLGCHLFVEPDPPSRHGRITPELEQLVMTLLDKKPERRVQTATELAQHLIAIAQHGGWIAMPATEPGRYSMQHVSPPAGAPFTPVRLTPVPQQLTPAHLTPHAAHFTPSAPLIAAPSAATTIGTYEPEQPKPTTLSGSASEQQPAQRSSRRGVAIALGAVVLATAAGIAIVVGASGTSGDEVPGAARQPSAPAGTPTEPTPTAPTPVETKPVETKAAETKPVETKPVAPVETKTVETKPVETKATGPTPVERQTVEPAATDKPKAKADKPKAKADKPKTTKPTTDKPTTAKPKVDLLETDI